MVSVGKAIFPIHFAIINLILYFFHSFLSKSTELCAICAIIPAMRKHTTKKLALSLALALAAHGAYTLSLSDLKQKLRPKQKTQIPQKPREQKAAPVVVSSAVSSIPIENQLDEGAEGYTVSKTTDPSAPIVYFTRNISPEGLIAVYRALGFNASGRAGVRINSGEPPKSNHLRPELISRLVQNEIKGTLIDSNAADGGCRKSSYMHRQVLKDHRFSSAEDSVILDEDGTEKIPVTAGTNLKYASVGSHFFDFDSYVLLTHFSGDGTMGFAGAIEALSLGLSSGILSADSGKALVYSGGRTNDSTFQDYEKDDKADYRRRAQESAAEAAKAIFDQMAKKGGAAFITVLNKLSVDSDNCGLPAPSEMNDVGICASLDPLALDQACMDIIFTCPRTEGNSASSLTERIESRNGRHILEHAEKISLAGGKRHYRLVSLD